MSEKTKAPSRRALSIAGARLWRTRWILLVAGASLLAVNGAAGGHILAAVAGILAVAVVIALAPGAASANGGRDKRAARNAGYGDVSAADLAAAVSDPIIIMDSQGVATEANAAARAAFGPLKPGTPLLLRFRSPEMQDLLRSVAAEPRTGGRVDYLERVPMERFYRVSATPAGESGLIVLEFRDQSETRRIDRMRADFVANASHELRTPLASIAGFIDTLRGPAKDDAAARENFLQVMQSQTERMARLIDDLLSLSRLEMKTLIDPNATVDLTEIVGSVIDALTPLANDSGVAITRSFPPRPALVAGSRDELIQVFENLLENACKYGGSGGAVEVSIEEGGGANRELLVTVRDFGPGVAEEHIPRLTERFYRVENAGGGVQKGTGLGLAIVKHILTRHKGYLSIKSEPGEGAAFIVHLPAARSG